MKFWLLTIFAETLHLDVCKIMSSFLHLQIGWKDVKTLLLKDVKAKLKEMITRKPGIVVIERYNDTLMSGGDKIATSEISFPGTSPSPNTYSSIPSFTSRMVSGLQKQHTIDNQYFDQGIHRHKLLGCRKPRLPSRSKSESNIHVPRSCSSSSSKRSSHKYSNTERQQDHPDNCFTLDTWDEDVNTAVFPDSKIESSLHE